MTPVLVLDQPAGDVGAAEGHVTNLAAAEGVTLHVLTPGMTFTFK